MANDPETISYININGETHPIDAVTVGGQTIPELTSLLPEVSSSDNGKVLRVVNGVWVLVTPSHIYAGDGEPSDQNGNNGDIYIQTETEPEI